MTIKWAVLSPHPPLLVPEIGGKMLDYVEQTRESLREVYKQLDKDIDTVLIISPHLSALSQEVTWLNSREVSGSLAQFGRASEITIRTDQELLKKMEKKLEDNEGSKRFTAIEKTVSGESLDHGSYVPLYYLLEQFKRELKAIVMDPGQLPLEELQRIGECIASLLEDDEKNVGIIISGDLSHKLSHQAPGGFHPKAHQFDDRVKDILQSGELSDLNEIPSEMIYQAGECGYHPLIMGTHIINGHARTTGTEVLSYETPFGVGYMVARLM